MPAAENALPVIVVGGGWAGITTAVELTRRGLPVTLLEAARQLGGRARCVRFGEHRVDSGQHLILGAYHALGHLLNDLSLDESELFLRLPLQLHIHSADDQWVKILRRKLPVPLHLLAGLLGASGLGMLDRLRAIGFAASVLRTQPPQPDISVQALLISQRQSPRLIHRLWEPLCLAALNTPIQQASAQLFLQVLKKSFAGTREDSDLLIPRSDLGTTLPGPALDYIERNLGMVMLNRRVRGLCVERGAVTGVYVDGSMLPASQVVVATGLTLCRRLLAPHPALRSIATDLAGMAQDPVCTVYLQYPADTRLDVPMVGLVDATAQWVFDRRVCGQAGLIAAVISGPGDHMKLDNAALAARVRKDLATLYPHWPVATDQLVLREKRATFSSRVGVNTLRPATATPVEGLWLAGDFTDTDLPATLEGAVISGYRAANAVHTAFSARQVLPGHD